MIEAGKMKNKTGEILFFVAVASIFWLFNKFSKDYTYEKNIPINFQIPANRFLDYASTDEIRIVLRGSGWSFISEQLDAYLPSINYQCSENLQQSITDLQLQDTLRTHFSKYSLNIIKIYPSVTEVQLTKAYSKELAIKVPLDINFIPGYGFSDNIKLSDSTVQIFGAKNQLAEISDTLVLDTLKINQLGENKTIHLPVPEFEGKQISFDKKFISVSLFVDYFTEKALNVQPTKNNFPPNKKYELLPESVDVFINVPLNNYSEISEKDYRIVLDYRNILIINNRRFIPVEVKKSHPLFDNLTVSPQIVEIVEVQTGN